jgi:carbamoyl-phosphate synthase large subunit
MTLTDREYQELRDQARKVLSRVGVETGGSNVQFAVHPETGRVAVIEMNPRVSRSSALASKATGFPIAKMAAKLAVGYTLDEIENDITGGATPAAFEPTIDYVVTKIPRFAFEKYPGAEPTLTTSMKSVGEAMAIGRTFQESMQKALRSLETGLSGFDDVEIDGLDGAMTLEARRPAILAALARPTPERLLVIAQAFREGLALEEIQSACSYEPWFLRQIEAIVAAEEELATLGLPDSADTMRRYKAMGFSDARMAVLTRSEEREVRAARRALGVRPSFKRVDTCAAEFEAKTPYMYSSYETPLFGAAADLGDEAQPSDRRKAVILGGGPNRIGQGIEFDYCCCHAAFAFAEMDIESIMVNCNPETVSTDYDTADRLYFEPLTAEDVLELIEAERAAGELLGVVVQYGGQTPLKLARELEAEGVPILGTAPDAIDLAEDRERFKALLDRLELKQPPNAIAKSEAESIEAAKTLGFPLVLRPSYVLGGRAMEIVRDQESLERYVREAVHVSGQSPLLLDRYLTDASEIDVDAVCDGERVWIAGVMEHIEEAGVHSGDSACSLPPYSLSAAMIEELKRQTEALARAIQVRGLMNVQYAVKDGEIFVLEVNPRASRTVPFVAKAIGAPVAGVAAKVMAGASLDAFETPGTPEGHIAVKEAVMPFARFPGVDPVLGPEMRSTGEVMGIDARFEAAFAKAQLGAGVNLPRTGCVFVSLKDGDKPHMIDACRKLTELGFSLMATGGTATILTEAGVEVKRVNKVYEGRPHIVDAIKNGEVQLIFNTTEGRQSTIDSFSIRRTALELKVPCYTTASAARAAVQSIAAIDAGALEPRSLQSYRH